MRMPALILALLLAVTMGACSPKASPTSSSDPSAIDEGSVLLSTVNSESTRGSAQPTTLSVDVDTRISRVETYHWNGGKGAKPGTIALRSERGVTYGPFTAKGYPAKDGDPANTKWVIEPAVTLPPGAYLIADSDPATWSTNDAANGMGHARVFGEKLAPKTTIPAEKTEESTGTK